MIKKGILIDLSMSKYVIVREVTYDDKRVDDMYVKVDGKDLIPAAYIFPVENREKVQEQLNRMTAARKVFDDLQAEIYYKIFPTLR